ncbi:hypothetical protein HBN54_002932 [Hymenobacter sp. 1B]|uniref:Uncharacterized protein n=1 Tax=Hymenobacter artigasi TaxID=2719616 RepID=A0ABX1HMI1_9BACT|nr:hypothetical protein [Hymenobacter artigasi]
MVDLNQTRAESGLRTKLIKNSKVPYAAKTILYLGAFMP